MSRTFAEISAPWFRRTRMRIFPLVLKILWAAALLAGATTFAHSQAPAPAKSSHAPGALPLTKFYDTPNPLPADKPGKLIRSEPFDEYVLPYQISAIRILYHSRSPRGEDVAVSGVVLVPDGTPPAGGWPVIAWAHDFIGSARQCAPSLQKNLNKGPLLSMYVGLGYAIVASDYAGLGTSFPNAAQDMRSNALDVIYSIPAARVAVPQLGKRWAVAGCSQGGLAAVGVAEAESEVGEPNYPVPLQFQGLPKRRISLNDSPRGVPTARSYFWRRESRLSFPSFELRRC